MSADDDVITAIACEGLRSISIERLGGWRAGRGTYRVTLDDGRVLKARRHQGRSRGARAATVARALDDRAFPAPIAVVGRVTLEAWVDGALVAEQRLTRDMVDAAAELLGRLHAVSALPDRRVRSRRSVVHLAARADRQLHDLRAAGLVDMGARRDLLAAIRQGLPPSALRGLTHGDFCAGNLVLTPDGALVCIDNEALGIGYLGEDVGRTWCRWPMPSWAWRRFQDKIAAMDGDRPLPEEQLAWRAVAAVRGAHRWMRARGTVDDLPRQVLGRVVEEVAAR